MRATLLFAEMVSKSFAFLQLLSLFPITQCTDWPCTTTTGVEFVSHKTDCRAYFICQDGKPTKLYCPPKLAFHEYSMTCVPETAGVSVNCEHRPVPYDHRHCKSNSTEKVADPKGCARYYDCGAEKSGPFDDVFLRECRYPKLWHTEQLKCTNSTYSGCGTRPIPIDKCEYLRHQCVTSGCRPCRSRFPSCKGLPDGLNAWPGREGSPRYIYCRNQRFVRKGRCRAIYGRRTIYDHVNKKCVLATNQRSSAILDS